MAFRQHGGSGAHDNRDDLVDINVIPLVDVLLVLLVVFMISAPLSITGINVHLPQSKAKGLEVNVKHLILSIDKDGQFYIENSPIAPENLQAKLAAIFEVRQRKELYIRPDQSVSYGKVVEAMGAGKLAGAEKISMLKTADSGKN
jgi:biopolymer transport protein TolR